MKTKIDFSDIHDLASCYARELRLLSEAIYKSNDKPELLLRKSEIEIASLERQNVILSEMIADHRKFLEDFDANAFTD